MSFMANSPLSFAELTSSPPTPIKGARGIFAKDDGLYEIDSNGNVKKLGSGGSGGGSITIDTEFDANSENAIANKVVTEFVNQTRAPKQVIEFANNELKLESREDGVYLIYKMPISETEEVTEETLLFIREGVVYADESEYAVIASCDDEGNNIFSTYTTKEKVAEIESIQTDSLTYFGTAIDDHEERISAVEPLIGDNGDVDVVEEQLIENNSIVYYGIISESITANLGETPKPGFSSALYFTTPETIPNNYSDFPEDIHFKGDSTNEGTFVPEANTRYTIVFDFDGYMVNGYVSGVPAPTVSEEAEDE